MEEKPSLKGLREFITWCSESRSREWWIPLFNSLSHSWAAQYSIPGTGPTHGKWIFPTQLSQGRELPTNMPRICLQVNPDLMLKIRNNQHTCIICIPGGHCFLLSLNTQMPIHVLHAGMLAYMCALNLTSVSLLCLVKLTTFLSLLSIYCLHTLLFLNPDLIALSLSFYSAQDSISCLLVFSPSVTYKIWSSVLSMCSCLVLGLSASAQQAILMPLKEKPSFLMSYTHLLLLSSPHLPIHYKITDSIFLENSWTF